jgi:PemK-like, MazF-like toxin of type II toxin-antitoxin system
VPDTSRFLTALRRVIRSLTGGRSSSGSTGAADAAAARGSTVAALVSPGQAGHSATVEIDPRRLRGVRLAYSPSHDGEPDPGEIVWTWVPYEERDGRGKDRPVAIVAASGSGDYLAVQLTSRAHDGDHDFVALGDGAWDASGRPSWARIDRVFRVRAEGMRREAASLDAGRYARITAALGQRYGWR